MEKKKFIWRFAVIIAIIAALMITVLLQNNEKARKEAGVPLTPVFSQSGQYEAVPEEKTLLGVRYVQVTIYQEEETYLIPELFRKEDYAGLQWSPTKDWLWVRAEADYCYRQDKNIWTKYRLVNDKLLGEDGQEQTVSPEDLPTGFQTGSAQGTQYMVKPSGNRVVSAAILNGLETWRTREIAPSKSDSANCKKS